jgi:hypothetical protein
MSGVYQAKRYASILAWACARAHNTEGVGQHDTSPLEPIHRPTSTPSRPQVEGGHLWVRSPEGSVQKLMYIRYRRWKDAGHAPATAANIDTL